MKRRALKPFVWPVALLVVGLLLGWGAEQAVIRWQDYQLYGLLRPAADLVVDTVALDAPAAARQIHTAIAARL